MITVNLSRKSWAEQAEPILIRALARNPRSPIALNSMGHLLMATKRPQEAIPVFVTLTGVSPLDSSSWSALGWSLCVNGQVTEAIEPLKRAIRLDRANLVARRNLVEALQRLGRDEEASTIEAGG